MDTSRPDWLHEIKHDRYRLIVRRSAWADHKKEQIARRTGYDPRLAVRWGKRVRQGVAIFAVGLCTQCAAQFPLCRQTQVQRRA
jgi:hypothetical protein